MSSTSAHCNDKPGTYTRNLWNLVKGTSKEQWNATSNFSYLEASYRHSPRTPTCGERNLASARFRIPNWKPVVVAVWVELIRSRSSPGRGLGSGVVTRGLGQQRRWWREAGGSSAAAVVAWGRRLSKRRPSGEENVKELVGRCLR